MNILFLDAYYEPEITAYSHLERDIISELVKDGNDVYVICPTPSRGLSKEIYRKYLKVPFETSHNGHVHVTRLKAPLESKNTFLRAIRYLKMNFKTYFRAIKMTNIDLVFSNSTPPTQGWIAGKIKKKLKVPFIYNLQDIFPDSLVNAKMAKKNGLIWKIGRKIENSTYANANRIITISDEFKNNIIEKGVNPSKVHVVPNWIDTLSVFKVNRKDNILFDKYNLDRSHFYFCYCGNIGLSQNIDLLLDVAKMVTDPLIGFVLVGGGADYNRILDRIQKEKIDNVITIPFQPYDNISDVFSLGDVGLILSKKGVGGSSIPSKTWGFMSAERPILASFDIESSLCKLIKKTKCGFCVPPDNKEELLKAVMNMKNHIDDHTGKNGKLFVSTELSKDKCLPQFIKMVLMQ